jgi:hypothetical protein
LADYVIVTELCFDTFDHGLHHRSHARHEFFDLGSSATAPQTMSFVIVMEDRHVSNLCHANLQHGAVALSILRRLQRCKPLQEQCLHALHKRVAHAGDRSRIHIRAVKGPHEVQALCRIVSGQASNDNGFWRHRLQRLLCPLSRGSVFTAV